MRLYPAIVLDVRPPVEQISNNIPISLCLVHLPRTWPDFNDFEQLAARADLVPVYGDW